MKDCWEDEDDEPELDDTAKIPVKPDSQAQQPETGSPTTRKKEGGEEGAEGEEEEEEGSSEESSESESEEEGELTAYEKAQQRIEVSQQQTTNNTHTDIKIHTG